MTIQLLDCFVPRKDYGYKVGVRGYLRIDTKLQKPWYSFGMTKLLTIEAEFKTLPADEQREFISRHAHLVEPAQEEYIFSDEEWAEIEDRIKNDTETFSVEEVMATLREIHASASVTK